MTKTKTQKPELRIEAKLAAHWRKKAGVLYSDFDAILGTPTTDKINRREPAYDVLQPNVYEKANADAETIKDLRHKIAHLIAAGYPLSFGEYHLAIGFGFLLADGITYLDFYTKRWHETGEHRGYGSRAECNSCKRERAKKTTDG